MYQKFRQTIPDQFKKWISRYDMASEEIQNLIGQNPDVVYTQQLDLTSARSVGDPLEVNVPGVACVIFGYRLDNAYNPVANTGLEPSDPAPFVAARINADRLENTFPLKHNRGFRGSFQKLFLSWPAQTELAARLVIFKYDAQPWPYTESDNRFNSVEATEFSQQTAVNVGVTPTLLAAADPSRKCLTVYPVNAATIYIGDSTVTTATGIPLVQGAYAFIRNTAAIYAISAGNTDVRVAIER